MGLSPWLCWITRGYYLYHQPVTMITQKLQPPVARSAPRSWPRCCRTARAGPAPCWRIAWRRPFCIDRRSDFGGKRWRGFWWILLDGVGWCWMVLMFIDDAVLYWWLIIVGFFEENMICYWCWFLVYGCWLIVVAFGVFVWVGRYFWSHMFGWCVSIWLVVIYCYSFHLASFFLGCAI